MKNLAKISAFVFAIIFTIIISCKKSKITSNPTKTDYTYTPESMESSEITLTVLGQQRVNPYTVENVTAAYNFVHGTTIGSLPTTDQYIRFAPTNVSQVKLLVASNLTLFDYPLDYEVISLGDYYHDSSVTEGNPTYYYAVIAPNETKPSVPYTVLANLNLYNNEESVVRKALELKGYNPDIEGYAIRDISGDATQELPTKFAKKEENPWGTGGEWTGGGGGTGSNFTQTITGSGLIKSANCACKASTDTRNPAGCIKLDDSQFSTTGQCNSYVGVRRAKITVRDNWFFFHSTHSNDGGCWFFSNLKFYGRSWRTIKFTNDWITCKGLNHQIGKDVFWYMFPVHKGWIFAGGPIFNNMEDCIDRDDATETLQHRYWMAATTNNALFE